MDYSSRRIIGVDQMANKVETPKSQYAPGEEISKPEWDALKTRAFNYFYDYDAKMWRAAACNENGESIYVT